jgi:hypothetical protein
MTRKNYDDSPRWLKRVLSIIAICLLWSIALAILAPR